MPPSDVVTELNKRHFAGQLEVPTVLRFHTVVELDDDGHGQATDTAKGITVSLEARAFGPLFYRDTLLHEMIHQAVAKLDGHPKKDHDGPFVAQANRIAEALDLAQVEAGSRGAKLWPQTLRADDYYGAAEREARRQIKSRKPQAPRPLPAPSGPRRSTAAGARGRPTGGGHGDR